MAYFTGTTTFLRHLKILKSTARFIESKKTICTCYNNIRISLRSRYYYSASTLFSPRGRGACSSDRENDQNQDNLLQHRNSLEEHNTHPLANISPDNAEGVSLTDQHETERFSSKGKQKADYISGEVEVAQIWRQLAHELCLPENIIQLWKGKYKLLPSRCGGCGAPIQFKSPGHLGFVPVEKLETLAKVNVNDIKKLICQNCFYLKTHNQLLVSTMNKDIILQQFKHLPRTKSLIIYIVDMLDIEGTMFPGLLNLIGESKRILVIGNKIDMLPIGDNPGRQQNYMMEVIRGICLRNGLQEGNIKDICLISGKTGYGIEQFLLSVIKHRDLTMDVCLVGCTNVGKSTIFNLLQNFLSVNKKDSTPPQATVHHLPGTTFGILRYPINYWNLKKLRTDLFTGVDEDSEKQAEEYTLDDDIIRDLIPEGKYPGDASYTLIDDMHSRNEIVESKADIVQTTKDKHPQVELIDQDSKSKRKEQCWLYDTPGLINDGQIIQFLKPKEIKFLKQNLWIVPRTLILKPGMSVLFGGLARLDFNEISRPSNTEEAYYYKRASDEAYNYKGDQPVFFTVFCPKMLPLHVTSIKKADEIYQRHFGTEILQIPFGEPGRKEEFPPLEAKEHKVVGIGWKESAADLVLAGVGWISVTAIIDARVQLSMHTPHGLGQYFRENPLMPFCVRQRGRRGVMYLGSSNQTMYEGTRKRSPQLVSFMKKENETAFQLMRKVQDKVKAEKAVFIEERMKRNLLEGKGKFGKLRRLGLIEGGTNLPLFEADREKLVS